MLYINPTDLRIIRNLGYTRPVCSLIENDTSFYHLVFHGNSSFSSYERKYMASDYSGRTKFMSEEELYRKFLNHYLKLSAQPVSPPLHWETQEKSLDLNLDQDPSEKNIEYLYNVCGYCPFKNRKDIGLKSDKTHARILESPIQCGFYSEEQAQTTNQVLVYKILGVEYRLTEIGYKDTSMFRDATHIVEDESHLFIFSHKETPTYGHTNKSLQCSFRRTEE